MYFSTDSRIFYQIKEVQLALLLIGTLVNWELRLIGQNTEPDCPD